MRLWRLLLHRIDSRNWVVTGETADGYLKIESSPPAVDIQALIARAKPEIDRNIDLQNLLFWGMGLFYPRGDAQSPDPNSWKEHLARAQSLRAAFVSRGDEMADRLEKSAVAFVAAVCMRDHWPELNATEQSWCAEVLCEAVEQDANNIDDLIVAGRNRMDGSRPAAYVLPKVLGHKFPSELSARVRTAFGFAIGHMVDEVRAFAAVGIRTFVWTQDRNLVATCIHALELQAKKQAELQAMEETKDYRQRRDWREISRIARDLYGTL